MRVAVLLATAAACAACGLQTEGLDGAASRSGGSAVLVPQGGGLPQAGAPRTAPLPGRSGVAAPGAPVGGPALGATSSPEHEVAGPQATLPSTKPLRGELVVSVVNVTGFDQLAKVVVVNTASTGDARAQAQALASWVNARGGVAGRKLVLKVHDYNAQNASEVNDNNLCQAVATDDRAFAVNLQGQIHYTARDCYQAKGVLALEGATFGWGRSFFASHSPYLWSPSYADYDQALTALVASAKRRSWLAGQTKVGVLLWDDKPYHEVVDRTLVPALKAAGVQTVVKAAISNADIGSIENGIHAAAQTMVTQGVTHLMFAGSAPLQPFFVQQNQQYRQFVYAFTSFDIPRYMATEFAQNMTGAIGVGFSPVNDVLDAQYPFPQRGLEATCAGIYKAAGVPMPGRYVVEVFDSKQAISYCETVLLLKHVADGLSGPLTPTAFTAAAERLGRSFQMAQTFTTLFGPGRHTGPASYRDLAFDAGCSCMKYLSGDRPFD